MPSCYRAQYLYKYISICICIYLCFFRNTFVVRDFVVYLRLLQIRPNMASAHKETEAVRIPDVIVDNKNHKKYKRCSFLGKVGIRSFYSKSTFISDGRRWFFLFYWIVIVYVHVPIMPININFFTFGIDTVFLFFFLNFLMAGWFCKMLRNGRYENQRGVRRKNCFQNVA